MLTGSKTPLIWPLLDKLNRTSARQQQPRSSAPLGVVRLPSVPWDQSTHLPTFTYGQVESTPTFWELAPWNIGQAILGRQPILLQNFTTNPRALPLSEQNHLPGVLHFLKLPARIAMISGVTRDINNVILGSCVVELYETTSNLPLFQITSDAVTGAFTFTCARYSPATHYLVAYKAGSPDVAGTTVNTLTGT